MAKHRFRVVGTKRNGQSFTREYVVGSPREAISEYLNLLDQRHRDITEINVRRLKENEP